MRLRVGFSRADSLISKTIRWFLGSDISHTYIRFRDDFLGIDLIAHADWPGVVVVQAERFEKENNIVEEYEFTNTPNDRGIDQFKVALIRNLRLLGSRYDYLSILGWAWTIAFRRWVKIKIKNPIDDPKKLICVDFCLRILNDAGVTVIPVGSVNPKGLLSWMRDNAEDIGGVLIK